jgi:hypothetical protein
VRSPGLIIAITVVAVVAGSGLALALSQPNDDGEDHLAPVGTQTFVPDVPDSVCVLLDRGVVPDFVRRARRLRPSTKRGTVAWDISGRDGDARTRVVKALRHRRFAVRGAGGDAAFWSLRAARPSPLTVQALEDTEKQLGHLAGQQGADVTRLAFPRQGCQGSYVYE